MPKEDSRQTVTPSAPEASEPKLAVSAHGDAMFPYAKNGRIVDGARMPHSDRWKHAAAAALHCWAQHAHHEAKEMRITAGEYEKAIDAACKLDPKGHVHPHKPALYVARTPKA